MGGAADALSPDLADIAENPAATAAMKKLTISIAAARDTHDFRGVELVNGAPTSSTYALEHKALAHAAIAIPFRSLAIGAYYRNEPSIDGPYGAPADRASSVAYSPASCTGECGYASGIFPAFQRRERSYGVTAGWERGALSLGAGAEMQELDEHYSEPRAIFGGTNGSQSERFFSDVSDRRVVPNAGLRWRVAPQVAFALAYNGASSFTRTASACNTSFAEFDACSSRTAVTGSSTQRMPDAYRAPISIEPMQRVLFAGDEYRLASLPIGIRAGWWRDPARVNDQRTLEHTTYGAAFYGKNGRLDLAFDESEEARRASIALVHSF
jgi:hypothetical protein